MRRAPSSFAVVVAVVTAGAAARADDTDTVYVAQAKPFLSRHRFEVSPLALQSVGDQFTSHTGVGVSAAYALNESVAFDVTAALFGAVDDGGFHLGGRETDETSELREHEALKPERVKLYAFPWLVTAQAHFSPGYGKVTIADVVLGEFTVDAFVGGGAVGVQLPVFPPTKPITFVDDTALAPVAPATSFGGALRVRFSDWLGAKLEVRDVVLPLAVPADSATEESVPTFDVTNLVLADVGAVFVF